MRPSCAFCRQIPTRWPAAAGSRTIKRAAGISTTIIKADNGKGATSSSIRRIWPGCNSSTKAKGAAGVVDQEDLAAGVAAAQAALVAADLAEEDREGLAAETLAEVAVEAADREDLAAAAATLAAAAAVPLRGAAVKAAAVVAETKRRCGGWGEIQCLSIHQSERRIASLQRLAMDDVVVVDPYHIALLGIGGFDCSLCDGHYVLS
jgi:hypothetical protein